MLYLFSCVINKWRILIYTQKPCKDSVNVELVIIIIVNEMGKQKRWLKNRIDPSGRLRNLQSLYEDDNFSKFYLIINLCWFKVLIQSCLTLFLLSSPFHAPSWLGFFFFLLHSSPIPLFQFSL